jgi:hypothetical protein
MNLQLALRLITVPTLVGSVLTLGILAEQALAADPGYTATLPANQNACELPSSSKLQSSSQWHRGQVITVASADIGSGETAIFDFSEAESDAAAILFGCDCTTCINALRQLRKQSLLNSIDSNPINSTMMKGSINSKGHCWTALQRRVSPQKMQEVLQNLAAEEAKQTY